MPRGRARSPDHDACTVLIARFKLFLGSAVNRKTKIFIRFKTYRESCRMGRNAWDPEAVLLLREEEEQCGGYIDGVSDVDQLAAIRSR